MKRKKLAIVIAASTATLTTVAVMPSIKTFADTISHTTQSQKAREGKQNNLLKSRKDARIKTSIALKRLKNKPIEMMSMDYSSGQCTVNGLNVRTGPSTGYTIIGSLNEGNSVSIIGKSGSWFKILYNNEVAYVYGGYISTHGSINNSNVIGTGTINVASNSYLNVRAGGTLYSNVIGSVYDNDTVNIIGQNGNWYEIQYKGSIGYIYKSYVNANLNNGTNATPKKVQNTTNNNNIVSTGTVNLTGGYYLNVRKGPSTSDQVVGSLEGGADVYITGTDGNWLRINYNGGTAYVYKEYVTSNLNNVKPVSNNNNNNTSNNSPSNANILETGTINVSANSYLNVRSGASVNSNVIGGLVNGKKIDILAQNGNWLKIKYKGSVGYVYGEYVNINSKGPVKSSEVNKTSQSSKQIGVINLSGSNYLNVRNGASLNSTVIGGLNGGTQITILGKEGQWLKINYKGSIAYVYGAYVNITSSNGNQVPASKGQSGNSQTSNTTSNGTTQNINNSGNGVALPNIAGKKVIQKVLYPTTLKKYVAAELREYNAIYGYSLSKSELENVSNKLTTAINPKASTTMFEFLKINRFRNVNEQAFNNMLQGMGVFSGQAQGFINAARAYNLDPIYLFAQSALETGYGTSNFARGTTITEVANLNAPIYNSNGQLSGYQMIKLNNPVKVYDLFGIGADNSTAAFPNKTTICANAYAYYHGWTSIPAALKGAAKFLHDNYTDNQIKQVTPYELRYINGPLGDMWHQYASDINYGQKIGEIIKEHSYLYTSNNTFTFGIPQFR